jgi:hypothetical protein
VSAPTADRPAAVVLRPGALTAEEVRRIADALPALDRVVDALRRHEPTPEPADETAEHARTRA